MDQLNEEIRRLEFLQWRDPDAWMERMQGKRWDDAVINEQEIAKPYIDKVKSTIELFKQDFHHVKDQNTVGYIFHTGPVTIQWHSPFFLSWRWLGSTERHEARDILAGNDGAIWTTEDIGNGSERMALKYYKEPYDLVPAWSIKDVCPDFGVIGPYCFYLGMRNKLWYNTLWRCDATTGENRICMYEEKDPTFNLGLQRQPNGRLVFTREQSQVFEYKQIIVHQSHGLHHVKLVPLKGQFSIPRGWILPLGTYGIDFVWRERGIIITKRHGVRTLWRCSDTHSAKKLIEIPGGLILVDPWASWENRFPCIVRVDHPSKGLQVVKLDGSGVVPTLGTPQTALTYRRSYGISTDGTTVYTLAVWDKSRAPKALLCIGYGAYGIATGFGAIIHRWAPLLKRGWVIACVYIRGGGDHTEEWGLAGRRGGRFKTIADFEAGIRGLQRDFQIPPQKTAIYGRSAGGLLVGATLARNPSGSLMSCVYTEVPYVDVLRTTTNPSLPLTRMEYNEFGNPAERLEDLITNSLLSPADSAVGLQTPGVFVLARTAENDSEVYAYEPMKWIRRLRESSPVGAPKLLLLEHGQGHFTPPDAQIEQFSTDLALLNTWMQGELPFSTGPLASATR